jgi:hypothetical protein
MRKPVGSQDGVSEVPERLIGGLASAHPIALGLDTSARRGLAVLLLGWTLFEQRPCGFGALATTHTVACDVDSASFGRILVRTPMGVHGAAGLVAGHVLATWAVICHLPLRAEAAVLVLVLDCGSDIVERKLHIIRGRTVVSFIVVRDVVLVQALALVAASTLSGYLLALCVWGAVVDKLEVRVSVRTGLMDNRTTYWGGFLQQMYVSR